MSESPTIFLEYYGEREFSLPIPELIKDAYPIYFGRRPKDEHYPAYRFGDIVGHKPHFERWLRPEETLVDKIVDVFDISIRGFVRKALYTCVCERMYQAILALQNGDDEEANNIIEQMNWELNYMISRLKKPEYEVEWTFTLERTDSKAKYTVYVKISSSA